MGGVNEHPISMGGDNGNGTGNAIDAMQCLKGLDFPFSTNQ